MTEKQIKRGLKKLNKAFPLNLWDSWYSYYLALKEHSTDSPAIKILEIAVEYALGGDPLKRIKHENKLFQERLVGRREFTTAKRGE